MHPHTERETSILRQTRGSLGTRMISSAEYFASLIGTIVKDGDISTEEVARTLDCPKFMIESWVSGKDIPALDECQRLAEKLVGLINQELDPESVPA